MVWEFPFSVVILFIELAMKMGWKNPALTLKSIFYTKKVLNFELTTNNYLLSTKLKGGE